MTKSENKLPEQALEQLPVLIIGAGPCGLVAAFTLQKRSIPFVIIEHAARSKICSNAGSGFELAPTAVTILEELGVDVEREGLMSVYQGMCMMTTEGKTLRQEAISFDYKGGAVNRAELQNFLLGRLFPTPEDEGGVLLCGSGMETYREEGLERPRVVAELASGDTVEGRCLLACDGVRSKVREVMHGGKESDPLHYCGAMCYWGHVSAPEGSDLRREFLKTQKAKDGSHMNAYVVSTSTSKAPSTLFLVPSRNGTMLNWAITVASKNPPCNGSTGDLTRRGGGVLTEANNQDFSHILLKGIEDFPLLEKVVKQTPAKDITKAGFFDRKNLDLPYTSEKKLVALLRGRF